MKLGFVGLGRMGGAMVQNLAEHGHSIIALNRSPGKTKKLSRKKNITGTYSYAEMVSSLGRGKKIVWLMIPAGKPVDVALKEIVPLLSKGDIIIDGGNSFYKDSIRRNKTVSRKGMHYFDCGTSGGIEGARRGACMMIGGNAKVFKNIEVLFRDMCVKNGYGYMGKSGAGHFVKMVHNGIEYGMMGAINEGLMAVDKHKKTFGTDMNEVVKVYANGSIIESHLMTWLWDAFKKKGYLEKVSCEVPHGETENEMAKLEKLAPMKILQQAREMRRKSRKKGLCGQYIATMRNQFGGHKVKKKK